MIAITSAPRLYLDNSDASGRFTLMMMSASFTASALIVAPTAVKSESSRPDLMPAPGSTAISAPSALNLFTASGEAATRGSEGSISLATAIFIRPPESARRVHETGVAPARPAQPLKELGQKDCHQGQDNHDGGRAVFHQFDEALVGRLMGGVIHAIGGRVNHFAMICHCSPQSLIGCREQLPQSEQEGNGAR